MILRFLVKFLLLAIVLVAGSMLIAQWKLEKDIDAFARSIRPFAEFDYESARVSVTGEVRINEVSLYIDVLKTSLEIGELKFFAGGLYDLAFLESNIKKQMLPENAHLVMTDVLIPFSSTLIEALDPETPLQSSDLLQSAFCGENDKIGMRQIEAMGYDYLAFSGKEFYMLDKYSGSVVLNGDLDFEEMFTIEFQLNVGGVMAWMESLNARQFGQSPGDKVSPDLSLLEIRYKDNGFNAKKAGFCAIKEEVAEEVYYTAHVETVEKLLQDVGIEWADSAKEAYAASIKPESEVTWFIQPKANFEFAGIGYYSMEEFLDLSRMRVTVNNSPVTEYFRNWTPEAFQQIATNELKKRAENNPGNPLYRELLVKKSFQRVPLSQAEKYVGFKIKATRDDGRVFEGVLSKTAIKSIWVTTRTQNGEVTVPLARTSVVTFNVFK